MSSRHACLQPTLSQLTCNETFSELGKNGKTAVVWHQAISGRRDEDIASAFHKYVEGILGKKLLCG